MENYSIINRNMTDAQNHISQGSAWNAIQCYDEVLKIDPDLQAAWMNKGGALVMLKQYDKAKICYQKGIDIDPESNASKIAREIMKMYENEMR